MLPENTRPGRERNPIIALLREKPEHVCSASIRHPKILLEIACQNWFS